MGEVNETFKIVGMTCDKYLHLLEGNVYLTEYFWPEHPKVIIVGFKEPDFDFPNDNWEFISLGEDKGPQNWSNDIIKFYDEYSDEIPFFMNMLDDAPIIQKVDNDKVTYLFEILKTNDNVGKVCLAGTHSNNSSRFVEVDEFDCRLGEIKQSADYRNSWGFDIWRTDYFLSKIKPNISPWDFEMKSGKNDGYRILTTLDNHPIINLHIYRKGGKLRKGLWEKNDFSYAGKVIRLEPDVMAKYKELTGL